MDFERERQEAIAAGQRALNSLQEAKQNLKSARNWGFADMLGGGMFSTFAKQSKMGKAKQCMERAKYDLQSFSRELRDVSLNCHLNIETNDFLAFADYFFDGMVADWMVQSRINRAAEQVDMAISQVQGILDRLHRL